MAHPEYQALNTLYKKRDEMLKKQAGEIMGSEIPMENLGSLYAKADNHALKQAIARADAKQDFIRDLTSILNKHSVDTELEMPDFIIADYICGSLEVMAKARHKTAQWGVVPNG